MNSGYPLIGSVRGDANDSRAGQLGEVVVEELLVQSPRDKVTGRALTASQLLHDGSRRDPAFEAHLQHAEHFVRRLAFRRQRTEQREQVVGRCV